MDFSLDLNACATASFSPLGNLHRSNIPALPLPNQLVTHAF